jgi:hypothetical protein
MEALDKPALSPLMVGTIQNQGINNIATPHGFGGCSIQVG